MDISHLADDNCKYSNDKYFGFTPKRNPNNEFFHKSIANRWYRSV